MKTSRESGRRQRISRGCTMSKTKIANVPDGTRKPKIVASKFSRKLEQLPKGSCTCFDCLRAIGLTPPKWARDRHKRLTPNRKMVESIDRFGRMRFHPSDEKPEDRDALKVKE